MKTIEQEANEKSLFEETPIEAFKRGVKFAQRWIPIEEELPEEGIEVLMQNDNWIQEEFNPLGIRIGAYGDNNWISAYWCNYHDEYHTRDTMEDDTTFKDSKAVNQFPTHWRPLLIL